MGNLSKQLLVFFGMLNAAWSQPFTDVAQFTYQQFSSAYKNDASKQATTGQYGLQFFYPTAFKNGDLLLLRLQSEHLVVTNEESCASVSAVSVPVGFQISSKNKKWSTVILAIPKLATDFESTLTAHDWQIGALLLENYNPSPRLKIKAGLYYNRELFGDFFVPLIGLDWALNRRWNFYGTLPTYYRMEYAPIPSKWYMGLDFKAVTRTFNNSASAHYIRFDEILLKFFNEWFFYKNFLLSAQLGYSLGRNPLQYSKDTHELASGTALYAPQQPYLVAGLGLCYRLRKKEQESP